MIYASWQMLTNNMTYNISALHIVTDSGQTKCYKFLRIISDLSM